MQLSKDAAVRETDTDAATSRLSAVQAGYLNDPYASFFVRRASRRPPLINVGTFLRTWTMDQLVHQFLHSGDDDAPKQILSLGCGTDTRFFRLQEMVQASSDGLKPFNLTHYCEVDFPEATGKKAQIIKKNPTLISKLSADATVGQGGTSLTSSNYSLIPADLRNGIPSEVLTHLKPDIPTLIIAEIFFIYLQPTQSQALLSWATSTFETAMTLIYDPISLNDAFGKQMKANLAARNLDLPGADANPSLQSQIDRLASAGFDKTQAHDLCTIRKTLLSPEEFARIGKLDMLDEVEELDLMLEHYCISYGIKDAKNVLSHVGLNAPSNTT